MTNTGITYERKVRELKEREGFTAIRSSASRGPFDVVAWNSKEVQFISVKKTSGNGKFTKHKDRLRIAVVPPYAKKFLYIKRVGHRMRGFEVHEISNGGAINE